MTQHLLVDCVVAKQIWFETLSATYYDVLTMDGTLRVLDWWNVSRRTFSKELRKDFDTPVALRPVEILGQAGLGKA